MSSGGGWNHRVVRTVDKRGNVSWGIHEAFYETLCSALPHSITEEAMDPYGETLEELRSDLQRMAKALDKTPLTMKDGRVVEYDP